jgi:hypothetical protein
MTESQRLSLATALSSGEVRSILAKLNLRVTEAEVESATGYCHVLQLKGRAHQISDREKSFSERICDREQDDVLLLGNTPAIEGFFLKSKRALQLKGAGENNPGSPPGVFVQAFLDSWQKAQGWRDVWLFISAPQITTAFARQRWNSVGTQPKLEQRHVNGQISRIVAFCSDGVVELPLALAAGR